MLQLNKQLRSEIQDIKSQRDEARSLLTRAKEAESQHLVAQANLSKQVSELELKIERQNQQYQTTLQKQKKDFERELKEAEE